MERSVRNILAGLLAIVSIAVSACAPAAPSPTQGPREGQGPGAPSRTLLVAIRVEPSTVATRPLATVGVGLYLPSRMFNAQIAQLDNNGNPQAYLVEALPALNSDSWRIFPDGRMETTYRLQPSISWHDGTPLTSDDFLFGWRVYSTRALGHAGLPPFNAMEEVLAPDPRTIVVRWRQPYPDVSFVAGLRTEFPPLPRHILEPAFQPDQVEAFINHSFWTREYVGLGPYRLSRWEPGAFIEGVAFVGHLGGRPKIERVRLDFASDARTVLARILAGEVHLTDGTSIGLPELAVLKPEWIARGLGGALLHPNQWRAAHFQHRPEIASPRALQNPIVRRALAHATDKVPLNESLYNGDGIPTDSVVAPNSIWGRAAERGASRYPIDLRRSEQLMLEAGFRKGPEGIYASPTDGRLTLEVKTNAGQDNESEVSILASQWRQAGFDAQEAVLPAAQAQDPEKRATFPGMYTNSQNCCESALVGFTSAAIASAERRWSGANRSGWSNPEYDRLVDTFSQTLEASGREDQVSRMVRLLTDDVQSVSLFIRAQPWTYVTELKGLALVPPEGNMSWNIQEWELR